MHVLLALLLCQTPSPPPDATTTRRGLVSTTAQAFSGLKTFDGGLFTPTVNGFAPVTSAAVPATLWVDRALGSDSNDCVDAGVLACATVTRAITRLPIRLDAVWTINVAAGVYDDAFAVENMDLQRSGGLIIQSDAVTAPVDGGSATGSVTSYAGASSAGAGVMTDSTQSWVVDALIGYCLRLTSGPAVGSCKAVTANTSTTVTVAGPFSANPVAGNTYVLQTPGATFAVDAGIVIRGVHARGQPSVNTSLGLLQLRNLSLHRTPSTGAVLTIQESSASLSGTRVVAPTGVTVAGAQAFAITGGSYVEANGAGSALSVGSSVLRSTPTLLTVGTGDSFVRNRGTGPALTVSSGGSAVGLNGTYSSIGSVASTGGVVALAGPIASSQSQNVWVNCTTAATGVGVRFGFYTNTASSPPMTTTWSSGLYVSGCATGLTSTGLHTHTLGAPAFTNVTTAIVAARRSVFDFNGTTPTFTGVTTELQLDGTNYTLATLTAAGPPSLLTSPYGSAFWR